MTTWTGRMVIVLLLLGSTAGCGIKKEASPTEEKAANELAAAPDKAHFVDQDKEAAGKPAQAQKAVERKIIYIAALRLEVVDFGTAEEKLLDLVEKFHGLLEKSDTTAKPGKPRSGHWK